MGKYKIIVNEPWDFEGQFGNNVITGVIIKVLTPFMIIFKSDYMLNFNGIRGQLLILKPRYEKQLFSKETCYEGTVGGAILLSNEYEENEEKYFEANRKYILIGSLEKV